MGTASCRWVLPILITSLYSSCFFTSSACKRLPTPPTDPDTQDTHEVKFKVSPVFSLAKPRSSSPAPLLPSPELGQHLLLDKAGGRDVHGGGEDVVAGLRPVDVVVAVHCHIPTQAMARACEKTLHLEAANGSNQEQS